MKGYLLPVHAVCKITSGIDRIDPQLFILLPTRKVQHQRQRPQQEIDQTALQVRLYAYGRPLLYGFLCSVCVISWLLPALPLVIKSACMTLCQLEIFYHFGRYWTFETHHGTPAVLKRLIGNKRKTINRSTTPY